MKQTINEIIDEWANSISYNGNKTPKEKLGEDEIESLKRKIEREGK